MPELERRSLGKTGMQPKALGIGCAWFGSEKSSDADTEAGLHRAIELGLDFIDTSAGYGDSERRVGLALAGGYREKVFLQTKAGTHPSHRGDFSAKTIRWSVENSLRLLKTDYLDSLLIHDPPEIESPLAPNHALDELLKMKQEGIIGHIGLGVRQHEFHKKAIETGQIEIILSYLDYTLLDQSVAKTTLPLARKKGIGIILASVFGMGSLSGIKPDVQAEKRRNPSGPPKAYQMWKWCKDNEVNIRHLAMQFCLAAPIDGIVMAGPSNAKEIDDAFEAATAKIDAEIWTSFKSKFGVGL
jgi:aryl-alcohol dehydrogenase-like predicted oxidoreductase